MADDATHPDDPETSAERVVRLVRRYRRAMSGALQAAGEEPLPAATGWLLLAVDRGPASVSELAARLDVTRQAVSRMAQTLVDLSLCERDSSADDRREVILRATAEGARIAGVLRDTLAEAEAEMLSPLPAAERERFRTLLARISAG